MSIFTDSTTEIIPSDLPVLHQALLRYDLNSVVQLLKEPYLTQIDDNGNTALHILILLEQPSYIFPLLSKLVSAGISVDTPNDHGFTPLHLAILNNKLGVAVALTSLYNANPWITTPEGDNSYDLLHKLNYSYIVL